MAAEGIKTRQEGITPSCFAPAAVKNREHDVVFELPDFTRFALQQFHISSRSNVAITYSELLSQELMGDLLLLVGRPAAEVRKQLLPVCFVFGLDDINNNQCRSVIVVYFMLSVCSLSLLNKPDVFWRIISTELLVVSAPREENILIFLYLSFLIPCSINAAAKSAQPTYSDHHLIHLLYRTC